MTVVGKRVVGGTISDVLSDTKRVASFAVQAAGLIPKLSAFLDGLGGSLEASSSLTVTGSPITDAVRSAGTVGDGRGYAQVTNLVTNSGLETNATGFSAHGGAATITRDATHAKFGTQSLKTVLTNPASFPAFDSVGVVYGQSYAFSVWVWSTAGGTFYVQLTNGVDPDLSGANFTVPAATWTRVWGVAVVPATATATRSLALRAAAADTFWADGWQMELATVPHDNVFTDGARATATLRDTMIDGGGAIAYVPLDDSFGLWPPATNLVTNPGFESNATGWQEGGVSGYVAVAQSTAGARFGSGSLKATGLPARTLTAAGNEITDAVRAAAVQGDGLLGDSSFGLWEATTNLEAAVADVSFESGTSGYTAGAGNTIASSSGRALFGTKSCLCTFGGSDVLLSVNLSLPS